MIRLYADEQVGKSVVLSLKEKGINITSVDEEDRKGLSDEEQLRFAIDNERAVLTHDSDFVKIVEERNHPGILFISKRRNPSEIVRRVLRIVDLLDSKDLKGEVLFV